MFQFLIGNSDAHGKNFSFYVQTSSLELAPWYDLVSVLQCPNFDTDLAMAFGDEFVHAEVTPFALADFAYRCGLNRGLMRRDGLKLCKAVAQAARDQAKSPRYLPPERPFIDELGGFIQRQASRLTQLLEEAAKVDPAYL